MISVCVATFASPSRVSAAAAAYHRERQGHLPTMLQQLRERTCLDHELLIVSEGDDEHHDYVLNVGSLYGADRIILSRRNGGVADARLVGARASRGDVIVFLDDDMEFETGWLSTMMNVLSKAEELKRDVIVSGFRFPTHTIQATRETYIETDWYTDGCCLIRRATYDRAGGYEWRDEGNPSPFAWRIRANGALFVAPIHPVATHWGVARRIYDYRTSAAEANR